MDNVVQTTATPRLELIQMADMVSREKGIEREEVLEAMEKAIQRAGRQKYGVDHDIRATIDRKNGQISLHRFREIFATREEVEDDMTQITLRDAHLFDDTLNIGDFLTEELPPIDLGRIAAQSAKQVIVQEVRAAERSKQFGEFKDRKGEIVTGLVKRVEYGNVYVDLGRSEAVLRRDELIQREKPKVGERIRSYIYDVREEARGPQIFLSRTHPIFMAKLFAMEVPEIYDGLIEIKSVARDPGSRAKLAVLSHEANIDPVGACVGMRGSRVQAVVGELQGEKIDIIPWSEDIATYVVNALAPAEVTKVVLDEEAGRIEVVVPDDQLSLAIGRRGQNVRLASMLTGLEIDILTDEEESGRRQEEFNQRSNLFVEAMDVEDVIAHLLVAEGFTAVEEIAYVPVEELAAIEGFDEEIGEELRNRAREWLSQEEDRKDAERKQIGVTDEVAALEGLSPSMMVVLGNQNIKTLDDVGDLAGDELAEMLAAFEMTEEKANEIVMAARAHWFED